MSLFSENVIPGGQGKVFGTNAIEKKDLERIKEEVLMLAGVKEVKINCDVFPKEFTVYTTHLVKVADVEKQVQLTGFHAIPKNEFGI